LKLCAVLGASKVKEGLLTAKASPRLMSVGEAAAYLGVSPASLRTWSNGGRVTVYRTPGGQRRYSIEDLDRFMRSMREPASGDAKPGSRKRQRRTPR
jgi:excisionase family DNA binding protein